jgi:hypothetical protein
MYAGKIHQAHRYRFGGDDDGSGGFMELTKECLDEIMLAARKVENGSLTITIQVRPEDNRSFDLKLGYEIRRRIVRNDARTARRNGEAVVSGVFRRL